MKRCTGGFPAGTSDCLCALYGNTAGKAARCHELPDSVNRYDTVYDIDKDSRCRKSSGNCAWRKRWDSNPRARKDYLISSQARYDHFDTLPDLFRQVPEQDTEYTKTARLSRGWGRQTFCTGAGLSVCTGSRGEVSASAVGVFYPAHARNQELMFGIVAEEAAMNRRPPQAFKIDLVNKAFHIGCEEGL